MTTARPQALEPQPTDLEPAGRAPFRPPFYTLQAALVQFFPGRSERWLRERCRAGDFGDLVKDGGGWLIPEAGILAYAERRRVLVGDPPAARPDQVRNLLQFQA